MVDQFVVKMFLLGEGTLFAIFVVPVIFGLVAGLLFLNVKSKSSRLSYAFSLSVWNLAVGAVFLRTSFLEEAATLGLLWVLITGVLAGLALAGFTLVYISAQRSNDIWGKPKNAYFGVIPVLNF